MTKIETNFDEVLRQIEAARLNANEYNIINIISVSKNVTSDEVEELYNIGQRSYGENRVQELVKKSTELEELPIEWHFIGRIQTNKINALIDANPSLIHSIDSLEIAIQIDKRLKIKGKKLNALLQINSANEDTKAGISSKLAHETYMLIQQQCSNINLQGVMSIGAHSEDKVLIKKGFDTTFQIYKTLVPHGAIYCSMGMSNDFEIAIASGSNMLRLGSILFDIK